MVWLFSWIKVKAISGNVSSICQKNHVKIFPETLVKNMSDIYQKLLKYEYYPPTLNSRLISIFLILICNSKIKWVYRTGRKDEYSICSEDSAPKMASVTNYFQPSKRKKTYYPTCCTDTKLGETQKWIDIYFCPLHHVQESLQFAVLYFAIFQNLEIAPILQ